jgi:hypothetical protein
MHFATFASHTPPPIVLKTIIKPLSDLVSIMSPASNNTLIGHVGRIAPTLSSCCTIICWEGDEMHYFLYKTDDDILWRCIWGTPSMSVSQKAVVFANLRSWYTENANANIKLEVQIEGLSWTMSTLLLMERG